MNDQSNPPSIGDNKGPAFNPDVVDEFAAKASEFADAAADWKEAGEIENEEQAEKLSDFLKGAGKLLKDVEARRKLEKQPFLEAGKEVDDAFGVVKDLINRTGKMVKPLLETYMQKKEAAERARQAEAQRKAREEAEAAERARKQAEERNDIVGQQEAEQREAEARTAEVAATKVESAKVGSATGGGKRTSLRTRRFAEITNINQAMLHYRERPEMTDLLLRLANAEIRAAKSPDVKIPGFAVKEERKL